MLSEYSDDPIVFPLKIGKDSSVEDLVRSHHTIGCLFRKWYSPHTTFQDSPYLVDSPPEEHRKEDLKTVFDLFGIPERPVSREKEVAVRV